jgi:acyl-CoA dehydrogenase
MSDGIAEAVRSLLARRPQGTDEGAWDESLGRAATEALADGGWLQVGLAPELGGEGGELAEVVTLVDTVSAHGWPSPVADLLLVTNTVLAALPGPVPAAPGLTVVVPAVGTVDGAGRVSVRGDGVAWAPWASRFAVVTTAGAGASIALVDAGRAELRSGTTLQHAPWAHVRLDGAEPEHLVTVERPAGEIVELAVSSGAFARSVQSLAALRRLRDLSIRHTTTREQFGRTLAVFQAVQQQLAALAGEVAAAQAAVGRALDGVDDVARLVGDPRLATAKIRTATAGTEAARIAHQLHGAIGTAREYELHRHTLALWSWREEFGDERHWASRLAAHADAAPDLWSWLADGP